MFNRSILFIVIILSFNASSLFAQDSITIRKPNTDKIKSFIKGIFPSQKSSIKPSKSESKIKVKKPSILKIKKSNRVTILCFCAQLHCALKSFQIYV